MAFGCHSDKISGAFSRTRRNSRSAVRAALGSLDQVWTERCAHNEGQRRQKTDQERERPTSVRQAEQLPTTREANEGSGYATAAK